MKIKLELDLRGESELSDLYKLFVNDKELSKGAVFTLAEAQECIGKLWAICDIGDPT